MKRLAQTAAAVDNALVQEREVREAVEVYARGLDVAHASESRIVHELALTQDEARIDVAAINGRLIGWEIKTAADTLDRLPRQERAYSRVFDRLWLVADQRHIEPAIALIPDWWGILRIERRHESCKLVGVRRAKLNREVDLSCLVKLLWREEALDELRSLGLADGLNRAPRRVLWERLADAAPRSISPAQLRARVRTRLRDREGWRADR